MVEIDQLEFARLRCIEEALKKGFNLEDPNGQYPQWLRVGVMRRKKGVSLSADDLDRIDRMGGTDHPDPTLSSSPLQSTISSLEK